MKMIMAAVLLTLASSGAFASQLACKTVLELKFEREAKQSRDWGFDRLEEISRKDAIILGKDALAEDEEADKAEFLALTKKPNVQFFIMGWNAPSNTGTTLIAADARTCQVLVDVLYYSEE